MGTSTVAVDPNVAGRAHSSDAARQLDRRSAPKRHVKTITTIALAVLIGAGLGTYGALVSPSRLTVRDRFNRTDAHVRSHPPSSRPATVPAGMRLVFNATFDGSRLDPAVWTTCYPGGCHNFGNPQEVEWYLRSQDSVHDGALWMTAVHQPTPGKTENGAPFTYPYRSGMVTTYRSFDFTYGYLRVVAKAPASGPDLWPALWLIPAHQLSPPEIDLFEGGPTPAQALIALHLSNGSTWSSRFPTTNLSVGWHTFALDWEPGSISWSIDGRTYYTTTTGVPSIPMYFIADLAVDDFAHQCVQAVVPSSCGGSFAIRSVQIWQRKSVGTSTDRRT